MSPLPILPKDASTDLDTPDLVGQGSVSKKNTVPLLIAKNGIHKAPNQPKKGDHAQADIRGKRRLTMPGEDLVIGLDPKKYPTGRISRAVLEFSGNDWMCKTLLAHRMVSVIQAVMRGVIVRKWFRASLMEASSRIGDRAYFKRLAAIGSSAKDVGQGGESMDILAQQVRQEEEYDAIDTIRRQRRQGPEGINIDEVKLLEQRFTRIGKEKAQSGKAYKEMTEHVITTGIPRKRTKSVVHFTENIFIPRCVHYNPFSQKYIACPEDRKAARKIQAALESNKPEPRAPNRLLNAFLASPQRNVLLAEAAAQRKATSKCRGNELDEVDSVSDWTDFDEEELESLPMNPAPIYHLTNEQAAEGEKNALQHGHYRSMCKLDSSNTQRTLQALETRLAGIRTLHTEPFNAETMELPPDLIKDLLVQKFASNTARLRVPVYKSVHVAVTEAAANS